MSVPETLLQRSWRRAWSEVGASGSGEALRQRLTDAWREPQRRYHTLQHLAECLGHFEPVRTLAEAAGEVELALWFHDAVYDVRGHDNEAKSAAWAADELRDAGVGAARVTRVHELVMATRHAALPRTPDESLLVDVDLAILGMGEERFAQYEAQVRAEYAWVDEAVFRSRRRDVLTGFLARPTIYATGHFRNLLETAARTNLERSIARLQDRP
jgi:predicted metal-dependent HD superfamily phosphohydrolase